MAARLMDLETGQLWELAAAPKNDAGALHGAATWRYRINRTRRADVCLSRPGVSKHHGGIDFRDGRWWVNDGGSVNTVTVNGERMDPLRDRALEDGDVLGFGDARLRFETDGLPPAPPVSRG